MEYCKLGNIMTGHCIQKLYILVLVIAWIIVFTGLTMTVFKMHTTVTCIHVLFTVNMILNCITMFFALYKCKGYDDFYVYMHYYHYTTIAIITFPTSIIVRYVLYHFTNVKINSTVIPK